MGTPLHKTVAAHAKDSPAIVVSTRLITDLLTRRLVVALRQFVGFYQPYPDAHGSVQIGLEACNYDATNAKWSVKVRPGDERLGRFFVESSSTFVARFAVTKKADPSVVLFVVAVEIGRVTAVGTAGSNSLTLSEVTIDSAGRVLSLDPANAAAVGLSEEDLWKLVGLVEGSIAPTTVRKIFQGAPRLDLRRMFPTLHFTGQAEIASTGDSLLIIARDGWTLDESQRCECGAAPPDIVLTPPDTLPGEYNDDDLPVQVGWPAPRNPPLPVELPVSADVALYLPYGSVAALTSGPYPAVTDYAEDSGFFGWDYEYVIAFTGAEASLTDSRATIVLGIQFYVSGNGHVNVDIPCIGRTTAGIFTATNRDHRSIVEIGITPVLQPDGKIVLTPELLHLDIQPFKVDCTIMALSALSFFGGTKGAIAAFIVNEVIRRVIQHNLPAVISSSVRGAMGKQMWTLVDLAKVDLGTIYGHNFGVRGAVSREPESLLVGIAPKDF